MTLIDGRQLAASLANGEVMGLLKVEGNMTHSVKILGTDPITGDIRYFYPVLGASSTCSPSQIDSAYAISGRK